MLKTTRVFASLLLLGLVSAGALAVEIGPEFTYQGQLASGGVPVDDTADLRFRLFDASTAGTQIGSQLTKTSVTVADGIFTVTLDFGVPAFDGNARWLEVDVRSPAGSGTYQTLAPRQALTVAPYALQTRGIFVDGQGRVGVGTTSPAEKLHVAGGGTPAIKVENSGDGTASLILADAAQEWEWRLTNQNRMVLEDVTAGVVRLSVEHSGSVGIGTPTPNAPLDLQGTELEMMRIATDNANSTRLALVNTGAGGTTYDIVSTADGNGIGGGKFGIRERTSGVFNFQMDANGHVGIGGSPSATNRLNVNGNVECSVLQINGGADIAEPFEVAANETVEPGMVLCIDPERPAGLRIASQAYDRTVAGVVSGAGGVNTGLVLRQDGTDADGRHPVALTGRVYCWVDADAGGPVEAGDLLTTSPTPGHAMRVDDHARANGAILGKAMTGLESGRGLVLVLVSLQ